MIWLIRRVTAKLFGWKYVAFKFGFGFSVRRLRYTPDNVEYVLYLGEPLFNDTYYRFRRII